MSVVYIVVAIFGMAVAFDHDLPVVAFLIGFACVIALVVRFIRKHL